MRGRKAKIGATLGPASDREVTLRAMLDGGLDVARINFSHGSWDEHRRRVRRLRRLARASGRAVALMADLQGPRLRVGRLPDGRVELEAGATIDLVPGRRAPEGAIPVDYSGLARDLKRGSRILIDDGNVELEVARRRTDGVTCRVVRGGPVTDHKGINLPGCDISAPALTVKDRRDLELALELGAEWLAVSFVRRPEDLDLVRRLIRREGGTARVMAKIERAEAIERLPAILEASDGLLVARGDLGVELPPQDVPMLQKRIIELANAAGKPVVTATQMLESMRRSMRPTRAEASDVANAVLDGSDCLLLTAETASGAHPIESVQMMARIIEEAEASGRARRIGPPEGRLPIPMSTCLAACRLAFEIEARCLAVFTESGFSARQTARFRPRTSILAFTPHAEVARALALDWGVLSRTVPRCRNVEAMIAAVDAALVEDGQVAKGDRVVIVAGMPIGVPGETNLIRVHEAGRDRGAVGGRTARRIGRRAG